MHKSAKIKHFHFLKAQQHREFLKFFTQMKIKFNTVVAVVSGALNIGLNVLLTMKLGSIGAAITTTTIIALSGIANFAYMLYLLFRKTKKRKRGNTPMEEYELSCMESHAPLSGDDNMQDSDTVK